MALPDGLRQRIEKIAEEAKAERAAKAKPAIDASFLGGTLAIEDDREAEVVCWPKPLSEMELCRRQLVIDQTWERVLAERAAMPRGCHIGPGERD